MNRAERSVQLLSLAVGRGARARFLEEWQADLAAAQGMGFSRVEILAAAARVAAFLLAVRVRARLVRQPSAGELLVAGLLGGLLIVVGDVDVVSAVPLVLLIVCGWVVHRVRAWVDAAR